MKVMKVRITFTEELLGTSSNDKEIYSTFIGSKSPDAMTLEEEVESIGVDEAVEKGTTVFPKDKDGKPFIYDYQIKGFFKGAAKAFNYVKKIPAYKSKIDNLLFVMERKIPLQIPEGEKVGICQRPLRASTAQGERVALASSESCPAGTVAEFTIMTMTDDLMPMVIEWLDYGKLNGVGQWHNSGKGRFTWVQMP